MLFIKREKGKGKRKMFEEIRTKYSVKPQMKKTMNEEYLRRMADGDVDQGLVPASPVKVMPFPAGEVFRVVLGATARKKTSTKATSVGTSSSRKPPKKDTLGLRFTNAHVTHPQLESIFLLEIIGVKKNHIGPMNTTLGRMTRETIIKVNVSELGLETPAGEEVSEKYAKVTNDPEIDGCVNAVLLV